MILLNTVITKVAERMPKAIHPRSYSVIDYVALAGTAVAAAYLVRRNRRAAGGAIVTAAAQGVSTLITDFPGGLFKILSFRMHCRLALGIATMVAAMPKLMEFEDSPEARYFRLYSLAAIALVGLTEFTGRPDRTRERTPARERERVAV